MDFFADFRVRILVRKSVRPATASRLHMTILADLSADYCPTRTLFLARTSVGDARVYTCTCTVDVLYMINYRAHIYKITR